MKNPHSLIFLLFLTSLTALPPLSIDMALPALRQITAGLAISPGLTGLTLTLFMAGFTAAPLIYGPLSDRYGRRPILLIGIALFVVGSGGAAISPGIGILLLSRLVEGAGAGAGMSIAFAVVRDLFNGDEARAKLSYIQMTTAIAPMVAPSLGALILLVGGWRSIYAALFIGGGFLLLTTLLLPESRPRQDERVSPFAGVVAGYRTLLASRIGFGYALVFALSFGVQFSYIAGSPLVFMGQFRLSALAYGLSFACNALGIIAGGYLNTRLAHRHVAPEVPMAIGLCFSLFASLATLLLAAAGLAGPIDFTTILLLSSASFGLIAPVASHGTLEALPEIAGTAGAVLTSLRMAAAVVASAVVAAAYQRLGLFSMLLPMLGFTLLAIAVYAFMVRPAERATAPRSVLMPGG